MSSPNHQFHISLQIMSAVTIFVFIVVTSFLIYVYYMAKLSQKRGSSTQLFYGGMNRVQSISSSLDTDYYSWNEEEKQRRGNSIVSFHGEESA